MVSVRGASATGTGVLLVTASAGEAFNHVGALEGCVGDEGALDAGTAGTGHIGAVDSFFAGGDVVGDGYLFYFSTKLFHFLSSGWCVCATRSGLATLLYPDTA
jgi:hypothetical protein